MASVKLFVIRHGVTAWTVERRFTGVRDVPMTGEGQAQAEAVARALAGQTLAAVYSSPLDRTRSTAELVAKPHQLPVQIDPALREMAYGAWEGLRREEIAAADPGAWRAWREAPHTLVAHGGETLPDVAARVADFVQRMRVAHDGQSVAVVSHAIVIRLLVLSALGLGPDRLWSVDASPAGISELDLGTEWSSVHRMNTLAHLLTDLRNPPADPGRPSAADVSP